MAKSNDIILYGGIAVAAYFGYRYAVLNMMIPDYVGLFGGPRTQAELNAAIAAAIAAGAITEGDGGETPANNGTNGGGGGGNANVNTGGGGAGDSNANAGNGGGGATNTNTSVSVKDQVWNAAKNEAQPNNNRLHFWQWNYYLPQNLSKPDPFGLAEAAWGGTPLGRKPVSEAEVINTPLTIDQYYSMVSGVLGLSGFQGINNWGQQASGWSGNRGGYFVQ